MAGLNSSLNIFYIIFFASLITPAIHGSVDTSKIYIVYMGSVSDKDHKSLPSTHFSMLQQVVDTRFIEKTLVRSYTRSFNGFAANLTAQEHKELARHKEVLSIFPSTTYRTQTTRSWDFMGFSENIHRRPTVESDIIIGVIDTGIWVESPSFSDQGFSPPKKWKGACNGGQNFTCNNKLIGARFYNSDSESTDRSVIDIEGHGTHTSSIAAGNHVKDASFFGIAKGTARGGVPSARIAAYKVCFFDHGCNSEDILAAFDDAIADGVDIISISVGGPILPLEQDVFSIGSFHAMQKGILVVQSNGNIQFTRTSSSTAPWIFSVAASTTDRDIISKIVLGNGTTLSGRSVNSLKLKKTSFPLVYGKTIHPSACVEENSIQMCGGGCLQNTSAKGKIVLCGSYDGISEAVRAGCLGSIAMVGTGTTPNVSNVQPIPSSVLNENDFHIVESYVTSTKAPTVDILTSESIRNLDAPQVAIFSSRGPNPIIPDILKPDITAPGVEILAAFSPAISPSDYRVDKRSTKFNILSGTSMACPHVSGAAAYVKSFHPEWSPSAIKSAIMTTAMRMTDPDAEFSYGSGHINPAKAIDPGLVYEILPEDYTKMLCGFGNDTIKKAFGVNCSERERELLPKDLNYPSMSIRVTTAHGKTFSQTFTRTVKNVGRVNSTYTSRVSTGSNYKISVNPSKLKFEALNEKKIFQVIMSGNIKERMISAALEWSDGVHNVRSPIVVYLV